MLYLASVGLIKKKYLQEDKGSMFQDLPAVTVQLPIFNERYVAERLLRACAALDYPRELLEIQALDDSTDDTAALVEKVYAACKPKV
jgi:cellulose synthase/poly-beta-1,6-N-acetylglucosamine synthase-like glycosyltransferase